MAFEHSVSKAMPQPGPAVDAEGRQQTRQEAARKDAQEQGVQKRKSDDNDDSGARDVQAKRSKGTEEGLDSSNVSAETLVGVVSSQTLRDICIKALRDETAGPTLRDELQSRAQDILASCIAEGIKERNEIMGGALEALRNFREIIMAEHKSRCEIEDVTGVLGPFLDRTQQLHERGPCFRGSGMAWEALIEVTDLCIHDWANDGELRFYGFGEEDCDGFHEEVDDLMLAICEAQKKSENFSWLQGGRIEEIRALQKKAGQGKPLTYRYKRTILFLEQLEA
ncbi:hypothetical protein F4777DRAFT_560210 [Nemania sp. FL0916]|nr:hypothetical protein F4777DRAFT_560210 [Nemania sp. FL0916]